MDTFVEMRKYMAGAEWINHRINNLENYMLYSDVERKKFEQKTEEKFDKVFDYIQQHQESNQKIFFEGQIFDAFSLLANLIAQAKESILLIDGYIDVNTLNILSKKQKDVKVTIYTFSNTKLSNQDINMFNAQYPSLNIKYSKAFHDRFLILDKCKAYHIGASLKDAGKKCFGINKIEDTELINNLVKQLKDVVQ